MRIILFISVIIALLSCTPVKTVLTSQTRSEYTSVLDSISDSGTMVGPLKSWEFTTDDGRKDIVMVGTLYRKKEACGSIQIRQKEGVYDIKIIDNLKKSEK